MNRVNSRMPLTEKAAHGYLWVSAALFVGLGIALMFWPTALLRAVEIQFETPTAFADIRADYGGCLFGIGLFLVGCAARRKYFRVGLLCVGVTFSGYASGRLVSLVLDGIPERITFLLLGFEIVGAALAFVCYGLSRKTNLNSSQPDF